jgi:hypothetical protein
MDEDAFETETDVSVFMELPGAITAGCDVVPEAPVTLTAEGVVEGGEGGGAYLGRPCELDEVLLIGRGAVVVEDPVSLLIAPAIFLDMPGNVLGSVGKGVRLREADCDVKC